MNSMVQRGASDRQPTSVVRDDSEMTTPVVMWLTRLRKAVQDAGWTLDALAVEMSKDKGNLSRQLNGERSLSAEQLAAFPTDVLALFARFNAEAYGLIVVERVGHEDAMQALATGLLSLLSHQRSSLPAKSNGQLKVETEQRQPQDRRKSA